VLLDLSAAFDTVIIIIIIIIITTTIFIVLSSTAPAICESSLYHYILLQRLEHYYGLPGLVRQWFQSNLVGRRQFVRTGSSTSFLALILCGVPQGSVIGPILFLLYTADLLLLIEGHGLCPHLYADDTQGSVVRLQRWSIRTSLPASMMWPGECAPTGSS